MAKVLLYLPRSHSISTPFPEFVQRWRKYSLALAGVDQESSIHILSDQTFHNQGDSPLQVQKLPKNRLLQLSRLFSIIQPADTKITLVSGNNFDALAIALVLRLFRPQVEIQASLHAEIDAIISSKDLKSVIKRFLLKLLVPRVNSLRVVRVQEVTKAHGLFRVPVEKIVVCPVPVDIPTEIPNFRSDGIGFLGRIHSERSPDIWSEIALNISARKPNLEFFIAGSGPNEEEMLEKLAPIESKVHFLGFVTGTDLENFWASIGLLLLTAKHESYGMAAREAVLRGVRIVAPKIDTYLELEQVAPSLVQLFASKNEAISIIENIYDSPIDKSEVLIFREKFEVKQNAELQALAKSWT